MTVKKKTTQANVIDLVLKLSKETLQNEKNNRIYLFKAGYQNQCLKQP